MAAAALLASRTIPQLGPRIVIAGTHSGVGKTTVATGIMAALSARGWLVSAAKVGPDFIDPSYHALATARPARSLNVFLSGEALVPALAADGAQGADILVVEGVMGMFDGSSVPGLDGSTASVSRLLEAPVVLVVGCVSHERFGSGDRPRICRFGSEGPFGRCDLEPRGERRS